jgi:glycosyltransferase involved in cell wall biosynthesis
VSAADAGVAVLQDNPTFKTVYPNKVFDYMAAERPVILAVDGAIRKVICEEANAGIFAPPEQPKALAAAIRNLADDPASARQLGRNGRTWIVANASRSALAARYLTHLTELAAPIAERASAHPGLV